MSYPRLKMLIAGEWTYGSSNIDEPVINPADDCELGRVPHASLKDLDDAILSSALGFEIWKKKTAAERQEVLESAAKLLDERFNKISINLTQEMGKPLNESRIELRLAINLLRWYAEEGKRIYGRTIPSRIPGMENEVRKNPVGPVIGFSVWNFPANNAMRKIAGALASGCSIVLKPSEETPATAIAIGKALTDAGLPAGVLNIVFGNPPEVSAYLMKSAIPRKLSFTGSVAVGIHLQQLAAKQMIRCTLELGGHAPAIVFDDCCVEKIAKLCVAGKFRNAGQVCISPTRFLIQENIYEDFKKAFIKETKKLKVGNGLDTTNTMGPLAAKRRVESMSIFVKDAVANGSHLISGGEPHAGEGAFFEPTVMVDVPKTAKIMQEEPFGPLAPISVFKDLDEVVCEANRLPFGLAAYAFTQNPKTAGVLKSEIETGMLAINSLHVHSPETPFGGVKFSGFGSEGGSEGLEEFLNIKYVSEFYP